MGALASNRKRDTFQLSNSPDFRTSKKPKFSFMPQQSPDQTLTNSTVSRISRYPESATPKFQREVHAPCRILRFGLSKWKGGDFSQKKEIFGENMGNFLSRKLDYAKKSAFGVIRYLVSEKEVIDVEEGDEKTRNPEKEVVSEDSSIEEVEVVDDDVDVDVNDGREGGSMLSDQRMRGRDDDIKIVEERSVVTSDGDLGVQNAEKMLDSLALNGEVEVLNVDVYKALLERAQRRNGKLETLGFDIELTQKKLDSLLLLRPVKKEKPVEEIPRELFNPLTKEEETEVKRALSPNNRRRVLVSHKNSSIDITGEILLCLAPRTWLNDEVINVYLELLKEREKREPKKFLNCHFFSTFFYKKLTGGRNVYDYKAVRRWTTERKLGYFLIDCDKIFVPIHQEIHWCLAIINKKDQKFQYLDSLRGKDFRVLQNLARYYVDEVKDKSGKDIDVSAWEQEYIEDLPEQENGYDCGMFMIKYADFYSRGLGLCFSQEHMPYFRLRTAKEILRLRAD